MTLRASLGGKGVSAPVVMPDDFDPYHDRKIYHKAALINNRGGVSPLCAAKPRAIRLSRESWTLIDADVTCPKCRKVLDANHTLHADPIDTLKGDLI